MKHLHDLRSKTLVPIIWYGEDFTCRRSYHEGYEQERRRPREHYDCATYRLQQLWRRYPERWNIYPGEPYIAYYCMCPTCSGVEDDTLRMRHYFGVAAQQNISTYTIRQQDNSDLEYVCPDCMSGSHPTYEGIQLP